MLPDSIFYNSIYINKLTTQKPTKTPHIAINKICRSIFTPTSYGFIFLNEGLNPKKY